MIVLVRVRTITDDLLLILLLITFYLLLMSFDFLLVPFYFLLFPTFGVGLLDFKLNSSPRPERFSSRGLLLETPWTGSHGRWQDKVCVLVRLRLVRAHVAGTFLVNLVCL